MLRHLALAEVLELHARVIAAAGGSAGLRDLAALESAIAQPRATFDGSDLYPDLVAKAAALGFALISNHPFLDGNKRTGHAAMEAFLMLNGRELQATVDDAEAIIIAVAAGECTRERLASWLSEHVVPGQSQ